MIQIWVLYAMEPGYGWSFQGWFASRPTDEQLIQVGCHTVYDELYKKLVEGNEINIGGKAYMLTLEAKEL
jgi:hypothetical protein